MIISNRKDRNISIKNRSVQTRRVLISLGESLKTMLEITNDTGILRANICRYIASFQRAGKVERFEKRLCRISKHQAGVYRLTSQPQHND